MIDVLLNESELFRTAWPKRAVSRFVSHGQSFRHPDVGEIRTQQLLLRPLGHPYLEVMVDHLEDAELRRRMSTLPA